MAAEKVDSLRVTAEEVALAAAALEEKRDAERTWREKSVPIGEAIRHLGLRASASELATEILSLRSQRAERTARERAHRIARRCTAIACTLALPALMIAAGLLWLSVSQSKRALHNSVRPVATLAVQKLAKVPDNVPVHIDHDTLAKLAKGDVTEKSVSVDIRAGSSDSAQSSTMFGNEWTIIKSNGTLLVSGWATVEFALNISNDTTGALYSSRPGWLPASNLVPVRVPVYLLEGQDSVRYEPDGKATSNAGTSVLMGANVADRATAVKDIVLNGVTASDENFLPYETALPGWSHVEVSVKDNVVHITGNATTARLKALAGEAAAQTVSRLHIPYSISNELAIAQTDQ